MTHRRPAGEDTGPGRFRRSRRPVASGGGVIRDRMLQDRTPIALTDHSYLTAANADVLFRFAGRRASPLLDALALAAGP
ncbi:TRIC cation channel family protein [Rhodococcus sp. NPDC056960]|uniref:TRIC cation channel family protein n=1 Tax=Rhodococcus sp. NPDC056960 TaxID=3345982 RepID=UPI00363A18A9